MPSTNPASPAAPDAVQKIESEAHFITLRIPGIGEPWPGEGGIYAGLLRDSEGKHYHLILGPIAPEGMNWDAAIAWAAGLAVHGHSFALPTLDEQALLYATLKSQFNRDFFWSTEPDAGYPDYAWGRYFSYGYAYDDHKSNECRVAAVRRIFI